MFRHATEKDLPEILGIYEHARTFMAKTGNPKQWNGGYPAAELLLDDIKKKQLYVCEGEEGLLASFVFFIGDDPTYSYIEGEWHQSTPYGVIHRIASSGKEKGVFRRCMDFCRAQIPHLRIDTHQDNKVMQHTLEKNGFKRCGTIYLANGDPRLAYELVS